MKSLPRLKNLLADKEAASQAYNKAKKAAAKKCGFQADVVHVAVKAFSGEKEDLELQSRRAEQLELAFEAIAAAQ
jgi:5,10-methylene-tetrahydrofolate dehydrogenase/methenyl tetrahydrofolate cyclohydrolase